MYDNTRFMPIISISFFFLSLCSTSCCGGENEILRVIRNTITKSLNDIIKNFGIMWMYDIA